MAQVYKANSDMEQEEGFENVKKCGFEVYKSLHDKLYAHQQEGLVFLYEAYEKGMKGVILADEMGLGKSIQVIAFLSGMMDADKIKNVLLVMPLTMKMDWVDKLTEWTPGINWQFYHYTEENPTRNLRSVQTGGDVLLTSYRMLVHHQRAFSFCKNKPFVWDCVIYDEAPELKSHTTKTFQVASEIQAKFTIILNGAPVLSNLQNMWSLFSIITPPRLLGNYNDFKKLYKDPITRATEADASPMERAWGNEMLWRLQKMIEPYFLSRTKDKIFNSAHGQRVVQLNSKDIPHLPKKTELVVWIRLSPEQETMYQELISSRGPSAQAHYSMQDVHTLKSICNHPRQLQENYQRLPIDILFAESEKLEFLVLLLNRLLEEGHRILVFCQSLKMLDIIQYVLEEKKLGPLLRIDGATRLQERERQCELFHGDASYRILLFSTRVGAVGLTLTSASRIVIVDPSWNQAVDSQAVNQAYRLGQKQKLVVYHLITCGTVEEMIYRKQVFKSTLRLQTIGNSNFFPNCNQDDLRKLLPLGETRFSVTQRLLDSNCPQPDQFMDEDLQSHLAFLNNLNVCSVSEYKCLSSSKKMKDMMEGTATTFFRAKSDVVKTEAVDEIQRKTMISLRKSTGQFGKKEKFKKHANHRKSEMHQKSKYGTSSRTVRWRQLLKKNTIYDLENESEHSDTQALDSSGTDLGRNTENISAEIKSSRLDSRRRGYTSTDSHVSIHNISYIAEDSNTKISDDTACHSTLELTNTNELQQKPGSPKEALDSPEHSSQCSSKLHYKLCDYSLSMSESSLLFEDEISDQQGSSSKLSGQSKECSIVHGLAAASQGVPAADVIQTKSSSEQRTQGGKPGLAQNHFNSPYDADKWREPISIPLFSDSNDESFDQSETEESEAEDSSDTSLEMVSPSINTPSEPQINNRETPSLSSMQSTISFENMMPPNKRNKIRWEAQKRSTKITFSSGAGFEKTEKDQLPSHHRLVLRELQPKVLKQKCSSASSALMVHPLKVHAPLDTDCKENYCHSNVSARFGQGPSKNSKLDVTCFPKTSTRVADGKMVRSQQPDEVQPGKCTESSISSSHSRLTVGQLIEVLQNVLQMLKN